jgi:hypothetical protein
VAGGFQPAVVDLGQIAKPNAYLLKLRTGVKLPLHGGLHQMGVGKRANFVVPPHVPSKLDSQAIFLSEV